MGERRRISNNIMVKSDLSTITKSQTDRNKNMRSQELKLDMQKMPFMGSCTEQLEENSVKFLIGDVNEQSIMEIVQWIILKNVNPKEGETLTLYINSIGGSLYDAFALIDVMNRSVLPIRTIGIGYLLSAALLIFVSGTKGERYIGKNTGILSHQFSTELEGKHHDIKAHLVETNNCNTRMLNILHEATGLDRRKIQKTLLPPTDVWLTVEDLLKYQAADHIY